ncbi:MAG: hypothetical protein COV35_07600 [Alphaproteobacteria bacterium CG11_big_fil_rev_8_21_14_0_20_39_49]|nr:MAG: hypothetical protein COV35_07600 [Alphaproteobacteria bacterium CG11_big_fil_rev_8_21_14_0_20_39_49]
MVKLKLKTHSIIAEAVEKGVSYGFQRSHKHTDNPSQEHIIQEIERAVMYELAEVIDFDTDELIEKDLPE